jgi:hypothetical protein
MGFYAFFSRKRHLSSPFLRRNSYPSRIVLFITSTLESTMSILSVLAFPAIKASRHGHAMAFVGEHPTPLLRAHARFELIKVVVPSRDALQVRKALLACADTAIVRCLPMRKDDRVELEIRFPAGQGNEVIRCTLGSVPVGEFGPISSYTLSTYFGSCGRKDSHGH